MQERLEREESNPRDDVDLTFDAVSSSARLLPENTEVQTNNNMGQIQNEENSGSLRVQYMVALAAVLGGMTMGTTIGNVFPLPYLKRKILTLYNLTQWTFNEINEYFELYRLDWAISRSFESHQLPKRNSCFISNN